MLLRRIGETRAREMLLLGRHVTGDEAAEWGMVHKAVPDASVDDEVALLIEKLSSGPTISLGLTKRLLLSAATERLEDQLHNEALALELSSRSNDFREGLATLKEKRPPHFRGT
jgi:2-(1,2-epoxy-1,2-dihydrophenyl)acetyl-CoA isomerase